MPPDFCRLRRPSIPSICPMCRRRLLTLRARLVRATDVDAAPAPFPEPRQLTADGAIARLIGAVDSNRPRVCTSCAIGLNLSSAALLNES